MLADFNHLLEETCNILNDLWILPWSILHILKPVEQSNNFIVLILLLSMISSIKFAFCCGA